MCFATRLGDKNSYKETFGIITKSIFLPWAHPVASIGTSETFPNMAQILYIWKITPSSVQSRIYNNEMCENTRKRHIYRIIMNIYKHTIL